MLAASILQLLPSASIKKLNLSLKKLNHFICRPVFCVDFFRFIVKNENKYQPPEQTNRPLSGSVRIPVRSCSRFPSVFFDQCGF